MGNGRPGKGPPTYRNSQTYPKEIFATDGNKVGKMEIVCSTIAFHFTLYTVLYYTICHALLCYVRLATAPENWLSAVQSDRDALFSSRSLWSSSLFNLLSAENAVVHTPNIWAVIKIVALFLSYTKLEAAAT